MTQKNKKEQIIAYLKDICLTINNQQILKNINLELKKGQITTLIGPNGGGKTSIARILLGILKATSGQIFVKKNAKIGYVPQKLVIDKTIPLTIIDFLELPIKITNHLKKPLIANLIKKLAISDILKKSIHQISGGQLQKILLLRSLLQEPEILVLDEPTSFMDIASQAEFYDLIEEVRKEYNCTILIISHDLHMVMQKTNQVICVNHHICCHGSPEAINNHPEYLSLFGQGKTLNKIDNIAIYSHHHDHKH